MNAFQKGFIQAAALALAMSIPYAAFATTTIDDVAITAAIKAKQATEPLVSPFKVSVSVHQGNVKLNGLVKTNVQYEKAVIQASSVENVQDVDASNLKVQKSKQPMTDTLITAKIKGKLLQADFFGKSDVDSWGVKVETKNGEVFLVGKVDSDAKKTDIVKIANAVKDVKKVNSTGLEVVAQ